MSTHEDAQTSVSPEDLECLRLIKSENFQIAIGQAIDLMGQHGDGFSDLAAMTILQDAEGLIAKSTGRPYEDPRCLTAWGEPNQTAGMTP